jgi:hypothetical protein
MSNAFYATGIFVQTFVLLSRFYYFYPRSHHLFFVLFLLGGCTFTLHFANIPGYGGLTVVEDGNCYYVEVESWVVYGFAAMSVLCGSVLIAAMTRVWKENQCNKRQIFKIASEGVSILENSIIVTANPNQMLKECLFSSLTPGPLSLGFNIPHSHDYFYYDC